MKINQKLKYFKDVEVGSIFRYKNIIGIKVNQVTEKWGVNMTSVDLGTGEPFIVVDDTIVELVDAELVIREWSGKNEYSK